MLILPLLNTSKLTGSVQIWIQQVGHLVFKIHKNAKCSKHQHILTI